MTTAIIYKSFFGVTKQYAVWLKNKIQADLFLMKEVKKEQLANYDLIVIMSGTYAGWMPLVKYLKMNWPNLKDKKVVVVAVGAAPQADPWSQRSYERIPAAIREKIKYFKLPGRMGKVAPLSVKEENLEPVINYLQGKNFSSI